MEKETTPSQSEWLIMEVFWEGDTSLTAKEVIKKVQKKTDMSPRMVRVLLNRLWQKGVLSYTVDEHDSRVYHYSVVKSKEECQKEKSRKFHAAHACGNGNQAAYYRNKPAEKDRLRPFSAKPGIRALYVSRFQA